MFGNGIQNRIIVFLSCLVDTGQDKIKKKVYFTIYMYYHQTYIIKKIIRYYFRELNRKDYANPIY